LLLISVPLVEGKDGNFYGVTTAGYGAVFQMTPTGSTAVLHSFDAAKHPSDAAGFQAGLVMDATGDLSCPINLGSKMHAVVGLSEPYGPSMTQYLAPRRF
jgi:uncharacterized repeat protein (TIGR03803 family)